jgi:ribosome-associated protein
VADDRDESARTLRRRQLRTEGERSARLASTLMKVAESVIAKLGFDDELHTAVARARAVTSPGARRRAERALAGELRRAGALPGLEQRLATVEEAGAAEPRLFQLAERWRARLITDGLAAAQELPGGAAEPLPELIRRAQRERATGRPPGAARALFRHVVGVLKAQGAEPTEPADD